MRDLVLTGGRIIEPATGRDETDDIAFAAEIS
jgi:predicted amidohydrolase